MLVDYVKSKELLLGKHIYKIFIILINTFVLKETMI